MRAMREMLQSLVGPLVLVLASLLWLGARGEGAVPGVAVAAAQMRPAGGDWERLDTATLARWTGPLELRWTLTLAQPEPALGLRVAIRGAGELRCNGLTVLRNGVAARRASDEVPGLVDRWVVLPPLPAGTHTLEWHGSSHFLPAQRWRLTEARVAPVRLEAMSQARHARWLVVAVAWGGLALTWLYFLRLRQAAGSGGGDHGGAYRTLVALGAVGLLLPLVESARDLWNYAYVWHALRLRTVLLCTLLAAWLLPLWALLSLHAPGQPLRWAVAWGVALTATALVTLTVLGNDAAAWALHFSALLATGWLVAKARPVSVEPSTGGLGAALIPPLWSLRALIGVALVLMVLQPHEFLDGLYTITLSALMVAAMLHHARVQQDRAVQEATLRQALHTRLLRTSMQPHGLMNTLAVLQELIEQHPAQASQLVDRLADQFTLLRELSQRDRVGLREELALVRTQLDLVGLARDTYVALQVHGPVDDVSLPPGVLHTLVENAITHGGIRASAPQFVVHIDEEPQGRWRIRLASPRGAGREGGSGQGQRFVRESLAGAFGDDWSFQGQPDSATTWLDTLSLPRA
jgi:hypothetical protein